MRHRHAPMIQAAKTIMQTADLPCDFDFLRPRRSGSGATRRVERPAALGAGHAAAALPIAAQSAIRTPVDGLQVGDISYAVDGFEVPAYRAAPAGKTNLPVVLVAHEIFGVHEYIADTCRRLAHAGYLAIAPALYARQGDPAEYGAVRTLMARLVRKVPDAQVMADLDGALLWAGAHGGDTARAGITGFCWGARITWLYAATGKVKAGVAWYGRLEGQANELTPRQPLQIAAELQAPVLGLYGGKDQGIALASIERMQAALATGPVAARKSAFVVYPGAGHAFHADYRPSYRKRAAQDGWQRALAWFRSAGVA